MPYRHDRPVNYHPRTGKAHDLSYPLAHLWLIAVYMAVGTESLVLHKRASVGLAPCVVCETLAVWAQFFAAVLLVAVQGNHECHNFFFLLAFSMYIHVYSPFPACWAKWFFYLNDLVDPNYNGRIPLGNVIFATLKISFYYIITNIILQNSSCCAVKNAQAQARKWYLL